MCHPLVGKKPLHSRLESKGHIREAVIQTPNELEWDSIAGCGTVRRHRALITRSSCSRLSRPLSQGKQKWGAAWSQSPAPHGGVSPLPGVRSTLTANQLGNSAATRPTDVRGNLPDMGPFPAVHILAVTRQADTGHVAPFKSQTFRKGDKKREMCLVE